MTRNPLILLHGALGSADQLSPLASALEDAHDLHVIDFPGHGDAALGDRPFTLSTFADTLRSYILERELRDAILFGHSMGGAVALMLAAERSCSLKGIITLGTKLLWTPEVAGGECALMNPDKIEAKVPSFARTLQERHRALDWKAMLECTEALTRGLGDAPPLPADRLAEVRVPVFVGVAERDHLVPREEAEWVATTLPQGEVWTIPGSHPIESVEVDALAGVISRLAERMGTRHRRQRG